MRESKLSKTVNLQSIAEEVLALAKANGASAAEVDCTIGKGFTATVRMGEVDSVEYENNRAVDVTVYYDDRKGSITTTDIRGQALQAAVQAACDIARYTEEDICNGLADKDLMAKEQPDLQLYFPWQLTAKQGVELALTCEQQARSYDKRITNSDSVAVTNYEVQSVYANSWGFIGGAAASRHEISCVLIAEEKGKMERDYYYSAARDPKDLWTTETVAHEAARRTVSRLGSQKLKTTKAPVLFSPEVARQLIRNFMAAISGANLYRESSFLLNCLGQQIFSPIVRLHEQPYRLKGWGSAAYDAEGVVTQAKDFVTEGVLQSYCLDSYAARRLAMKSTANAGGAHNLFLEQGSKSQAELISSMGRGLLVTDLMGQGVNLLTGDYSRGAAGFWVEHGEIQFPVAEVTIAGNLADMFQHIIAIGNDVDIRSDIQTGSILIEEMTLAGQ